MWFILWVSLCPGFSSDVESSGSPMGLLPSTESADMSDLEQLSAFFKDAKVVGLGEANHGTAEFFRYKNRLIRYLVTTHGFRYFLIESGLFSCESLNAYVLGEDVALADALADQQYTIWYTQEVAELFVWMREYNQTAKEKVRVSGFDSRDNGNGRDALKAYLKEKDPGYFAQQEALLEAVTLTGFGDASQAQAHGEALKSIQAYLDGKKASWGTGSGKRAFLRAYQALKVLQQANGYAQAPTPQVASNNRDLHMAENIQFLAADNPGTKWMVWAHNGHIGVGTNGVPNGTNLGAHLNQWLGAGYVNVGFGFGKGTFRAYGDQNGVSSYHAFPTGEPLAGSLDAALNALGSTPFFLDLTQAIPKSLAETLPIRWADGAVGPNYLEIWSQSSLSIRVAEQFDGIIFVPEISAAKTYRP